MADGFGLRRSLARRDASAAHLPFLVTGGCGLIGAHLTAALAARGKAVRVLDDLSSKAGSGDLASDPGAERSGDR